MPDRPTILPVRLVFADQGTYHAETVRIPLETSEHQCLLDLLREEPSVTALLYIDLKRSVSASVLDEEAAA